VVSWRCVARASTPCWSDEARCAYNQAGVPDGDGFGTERRGAVTVLYGKNLFEFAPLLGELLSRAALQREVPPELRGRA